MVRGAGGCSRLQEELQESGRTSEEGDERSSKNVIGVKMS
jgi:hypothetical protein